MSYTTAIQIQPLETKRASLYTCIRYASKFIKSKTDIRKHRTLPNNDTIMQVTPLTSYNEKSYCYEEEETMTLYDEKRDMMMNSSYNSRRESQLALPSRLKYTVNSTPINIVHEELDNNEDEEEDEFDDDDEEEDEVNYILKDQDAYTSTLQKLSGISFQSRSKKTSTAVLITLSPCALAAANAARQRRQKIRVM